MGPFPASATTLLPPSEPKMKRPTCPSTVDAGKIGNIPVIECRGYVDVIHETAEARSEDDTYLRIEIDLTPDEGRWTFDSF